MDRQTDKDDASGKWGGSQPASSQPGHTPSLSLDSQASTLLSSSCPPEFPGRGKKKSDDVPYLVEQYPFKIATTNDDEWMGMARWLLCPGTYRCRAVDGKQLSCFPGASELVCVSDTNRGYMID